MFTLAFLAALAAGPQVGPIKAFGDWVVACDNVHACEMTSLMPGDGMTSEGDEYSAVSLSLARRAGPAAMFDAEFQFSVPKVTFARVQVDGRIIASGAVRNDQLRFTGADATRIVDALVKGKRLTIGDSADTLIGIVSLQGSTAALRFIDAEQGRADTVSAAVARGRKPATAAAAAPAVPVIPSVRPGGKPAAIGASLVKTMGAESDCASEFGEAPPKVEGHALGGGRTLALLPCGAGAYNFLTVPFVVIGGKPVLAQFDVAPGMTASEAKMPMLVNAEWDPKTGRLSSYSKGRGLGDCGSAEDYVWDGTRFRLVEARQMIECRGSVNWLTIWRANAAAQ